MKPLAGIAAMLVIAACSAPGQMGTAGPSGSPAATPGSDIPSPSTAASRRPLSASDQLESARTWVHETTGALLTDIAGPEHCGWQSARMMHTDENGVLARQYLRDPNGVFGFAPLLDTYAEGVELPDDATDSGYRSPEGWELWFTKSDTAAFVVTPEGIERWPGSAELIGCA